MKIIESILTKNPCYTAGRKITVKGLMLHSVGCPQPKASAFLNYWNGQYDKACVHAFIDGNDGTVYQTLPWNHRGWHGGGSSNNTHIGVEMCEPACITYTGGSSFICNNLAEAKAVVKRTYESAVELFAFLCKEYKLDPLADGVIISHKEGHARGIASNHGDPEHLWKQLDMGYTMDTFRNAVKKAMTVDEQKTDEPEKEDVMYRVQVGAYKVKENADAQLKRVKDAGFDTYMIQVDGYYKIQVGAYSKKANAENMYAKLRTAGFDAFITTKGGTAVSTTTKKSVDEIAKEVIQGKWGNGAERKTKLEKAGYDYATIQKKVNELLK
jgi:N-acetylmuramoyl-L-alanine amidase CwlA